MGRVSLAAVLVVAVAGVATAAPTRKVTIETDPPGATVFVGDKESGAVGTTPCTIDLPIGDSTLIVELSAYVSEIENVTVEAKRGKPQLVQYTLTKAIGTIVVDGGGAAKGATIKIDGEAKGTAPARVDVEAGAHQVQVIAGRLTLFDDFVTVDAGAEVAVSPKAGDGTDGARDPDGEDPALHARVAPPPDLGAPLVALDVVTDIAFRHFSYQNPSPDLLAYSQGGQIAFGVDAQVWPFDKLGVHALAPLSLFAHASFYNVAQQLENADVSLSTFWRTYEVSARYRRVVMRDRLALEGNLGYALDQYEFSGVRGDLAKVPDASYSGIRIGARVSLPLGAFGPLDMLEPYLALENRIMISAKLQESAFAKTDADGKRIAIGATARSGRWRARVEASFTSYGWSFTDATDSPTMATGATDNVEDITLSVGGSY